MVKEYVEAPTNTHQPDKQENKRSSTLIPWFETALIVLGLELVDGWHLECDLVH